MKYIFISAVFFSLSVYGAAPVYYQNDGSSTPELFDTKSNEPMKVEGQKKIIKKSETTTIEKQEEAQEFDNKPVMNGNPNDEPYTIGPLPMKPGVQDTPIPEEMQSKEDALDYSTSPDRTTVPQKDMKQKKLDSQGN